MKMIITLLVEVTALGCCLLSLRQSARAVNKSSTFDKVFFGIISVVFLMIAIWYANSTT